MFYSTLLHTGLEPYLVFPYILIVILTIIMLVVAVTTAIVMLTKREKNKDK